MISPQVEARFPEKAKVLFKPAPYKVLYGGRGGSKSWDIARALLILGMNKKLFIVCGREIQKSIKESVHKLLVDQIDILKFGSFYRPSGVLESEIVGDNGTRFVFVGLRNNIASIKSMEGIDILWVTEAAHLSKVHWNVIIPTVRRDAPFGPFSLGSEIWIDFNPDLETDDTYQMFVAKPPTGAVVVFVNWKDNPFFPAILHRQMEDMKRDDYDEYLNVWMGRTRRYLQGAIYAKELRAALEEGRIGSHVKIDRSRGVDIAFDLGKSDMAAFWAFQQIGMDHNAVGYYGNCGFGMDHYLEEIQRRRYLVRRILLPHDAVQDPMAASKSIERQVKDVFKSPGQVLVVKRTSIVNGINYTRAVFPRMNFNDTECADGITALTHYQYGVNAETQQRTKEPLHNWASHPADALRTYTTKIKEGQSELPGKQAAIEQDAWNYGGSQSEGWMQ